MVTRGRSRLDGLARREYPSQALGSDHSGVALKGKLGYRRQKGLAFSTSARKGPRPLTIRFAAQARGWCPKKWTPLVIDGAGIALRCGQQDCRAAPRCAPTNLARYSPSTMRTAHARPTGSLKPPSDRRHLCHADGRCALHPRLARSARWETQCHYAASSAVPRALAGGAVAPSRCSGHGLLRVRPTRGMGCRRRRDAARMAFRRRLRSGVSLIDHLF